MDYTTIGVDVSKHFLDVCKMPTGEISRFRNDKEGFKAFLKSLNHKTFKYILMEDTGCYHKAFYHYLLKHYDNVFVINPKRVRDFAKATGQLAKTDKLDAWIIALYGERMDIIAKMKPNAQTEKLRARVTRRRQLVHFRKQERNHVETCLDEDIKASILAKIADLNKDIKELEKEIKELITNDPTFKSIYDRLKDIKGVGDVLIMTLLSDLPEIGYLNKRQIAALVGVAPMNHDSGNMIGCKHIQGGRPVVREAMYMATVSAIRCNKVISEYYQHLIEKGKPAKVAITACMRKLLLYINGVFQKEIYNF